MEKYMKNIDSKYWGIAYEQINSNQSLVYQDVHIEGDDKLPDGCECPIFK